MFMRLIYVQVANGSNMDQGRPTSTSIDLFCQKVNDQISKGQVSECTVRWFYTYAGCFIDDEQK